MSVPSDSTWYATAQLCEAIKAELKAVLQAIATGKQLSQDSWKMLLTLTSQVRKLPYKESHHAIRVLMRLTAAHAVCAFTHYDVGREQATLDMLDLLDDRVVLMDYRTQLTLHTFQALLAHAVNKRLSATHATDRMAHRAHTAPTPLVQACIWLVCGEIGVVHDRYKALRKALKLLKQLDQTFEVRLLIQRVHLGLFALHGKSDRPWLQLWNARRANKLTTELRLRQGLDATSNWVPSHPRLIAPLLQLLEIR